MKTFKIIVFVVSVAIMLAAQTGYTPGNMSISCAAVTVTGACTAYSMPSTGSTLPSAFTWQTIYTGSPTGTTVNFEGSLDYSTWSTMDSTTNTSGETRSISNKPVKFVRCNVTTLSGGSAPTATCQFIVKGY